MFFFNLIKKKFVSNHRNVELVSLNVFSFVIFFILIFFLFSFLFVSNGNMYSYIHLCFHSAKYQTAITKRKMKTFFLCCLLIYPVLLSIVWKRLLEKKNLDYPGNRDVHIRGQLKTKIVFAKFSIDENMVAICFNVILFKNIVSELVTTLCDFFFILTTNTHSRSQYIRLLFCF